MQQYPGLGKILPLATYPGTGSGTQPEPVAPQDNTVPDSEYSMWDAVNDSRQTTITVECPDGLSTDLTIELGTDPTFDAFYELDVIPATADVLATWVTQLPIKGCIRINNTSGENIGPIYIQKETATFG